jgi:chaperonin cofactor prefoldin
MAELPPQCKVKIREIVQLEIEITALIQQTTNISASQDELNKVNAKVKKLVQSLRRKLEVCINHDFLYSVLNVLISW